MKFGKFTAPTDDPVWINIDSIMRFAKAGEETAAPSGTTLWLIDGTQVVKEAPEVVLSIISR